MKNLAIVIGGSSGIGLAVTRLLSSDYTVINMSRTPGENTIVTDVTSMQSVRNGFVELQKYGTPKIMVYCAGFVEPQGILEIDTGTLKHTIGVNLAGAFFCTQEFVKLRKELGGKIIYVASTAGTRPQPGWSAYSSSKAGLINFALTMSEELKDYRIKVYCVAPGRCNTSLRKKLAPTENPNLIMQPSEVAEFIMYLVNNGHLLDGQILVVRRNKNA